MNKKLKITIFLAVLLILLTGCFFYLSYKINTPLNKQVKIAAVDKVFVVAAGDGVFDIGPKLQNADLISHRFWFISFVLTRGWGTRLQAGQYSLSASLSIPEIATKFVRGQVIDVENDITVTIPKALT